eukprot:TRINITY_DN57206_c0_g1_i1.p1 TRINITY_DN57206_c0_g1~~TRINITY_DN57206_c0_g1_i1.p1  ORF type:complete len:510 (+),score=76.77 TRINITY_DN57206_c0_g1_i1:65-1531(+)
MARFQRRPRCHTVGTPAAPVGAAKHFIPSTPVTEGKWRHRGSRWADPGACAALCMLILDDRKSGNAAEPRNKKSKNDSEQGDTSSASQSSSSADGCRRALPPFLYTEMVAPFLRFDSPLPNMLYAFGGRNQGRGPLDMTEMFDTWHGHWVSCAAMPTRRAGSAAALLPDNRMIVIGGYNERGIAEGLLATCDVYDPYLQRWEEEGGAASLSRKRWGHGCASLCGKVYVVGGCSLQPDAQPQEAFMETLKCCEVYSPAEDRWRPCAPLHIARSGSRVVALDDRHLAAIGGCDDVFGRAEMQPTVELFDSTTEQWTLLDSRLENPRTTAAVAAIGERRLLVVGGAPSLSSAEVYDVQLPGDGKDKHSADGRKEKPPIDDMPEGRMGCQAAVVCLPGPGATYPLADRPCAVIVGGERCDESGGVEWPRVRQFPTIPVFDVKDGAWRKDSEPIMPAMAAARTAVALCVGVGHVVPYNPVDASPGDLTPVLPL